MKRSGWMRALCVLLMAALVPVMPIGGFGGAGVVQAGSYSENGLIYWYEPDIYGNYANFYWYIETGEPHEVAVGLYRMPGMTEVPVDPDNLDLQGGYYSHLLEPGSYMFVLELWMDGVLSDEISHTFDIPEPVTRTVYLFGTEALIQDLEFRQIWPEIELQWTADPAPGKGYVRYTVEVYEDRCFELKSELYHFTNARDLCAEDAEEFVVKAYGSPYTAELINHNFHEEEGLLTGWIVFDRREDYNFSLKIFDQSGTSQVCDFDGDFESGWEFECELPAEPSFLQIFADGNPTNAVLRLDETDLPGNFAMTDRDSRLGWIDAEIAFDGLGDEGGIALYRLIPPRTDFRDRAGIRHVPADGSGSYSASLPFEFPEFDYGSIVIQLLDTEGDLFADNANFPIIDNMSDLDKMIDYEADGFEALTDDPEPADASFTDTELNESAGRIEWTIPDSGNFQLLAYDLYYADGEFGIFRGEARAFLPFDTPETFEYTLQDVPAGAEYVAVVPLYQEWDESYNGSYYAPTFYVPLNDGAVPRLDLLMVDDEEVSPLPQNPKSYEVIVDGDAEEVTVTAWSEAGAVVIEDEGPDSMVTKTIALSGTTTTVTIQVRSLQGDWSTDYVLTIIKEQEPAPPSLTGLAVNGQPVAPVGQTLEYSVPYETESVTVAAYSEAGVEISMNGETNAGSISADIPFTEDELPISIMLYDPVTTMTSEYTLLIRRSEPDSLVIDVVSGRLEPGNDGLEYRYVTKGTTVGELKQTFILVQETAIEVRDSGGNVLTDADLVPSGATVELCRGEMTQTIRLHLLSGHVKSTLGLSSGSPLSFVHVAAFWIRFPSDLNGDGMIDQRDVRLLLSEMD